MASAPGGGGTGGASRLGSPRVVVPVFVALLLLYVLLSPQGPADARGALTSHSAAPGGARGLYDGLQRLGWPVSRRELPFTEGALDSGAVYAVLGPGVPLSAGEVHRLLETVRAGAGLLVVVPDRGALADSLHVRHSAEGAPLDTARAGLCPDSLNRQGLITWPGGRVYSYWLTQYPRAGAVTFARVREDTLGLRAPATPATPQARALVAHTAMAGFPLGRGRVVAVADPDLLRNDVLRVCRWNAGLTAVRAVEWLAAGGSRPVIFDEYRHGYGVHADPGAAIRDALLTTGPGRAVVQVAIAALILLAALGIRALPPRPQPVVERRSPLEHVGALARAYEQVGATRLATRRLVRGLRRRHGAGTRAGVTDEEFLHTLAARRRGVAGDATLLAQALSERRPTRDLGAVGDAAARIDEALRTGP